MNCLTISAPVDLVRLMWCSPALTVPPWAAAAAAFHFVWASLRELDDSTAADLIQGVHVTTMRGSVRIYIHMYIYTERVRPYIRSYIYPRGLGRTDPHRIPPRTSRTPAINPMMHCVLICPPRAALAGRTACIAAQQRGRRQATICLLAWLRCWGAKARPYSP